ncbi:hypothetical protein [Acetivibrio clariflavus]|uniref:Uncharacterized protein n=1 Tax=Acetivibrio clariflavus (strain DSM 19732 / NBRC 101661 / EBR45) TaxID=720554 RepID=G8M258_ACECE|nr:hypothetical protein [Acetivibrio clariflavus]AEV68176.1 hypothetical protein Clocl_1538 [Acetivibrio clariflavus DSM 19732]
MTKEELKDYYYSLSPRDALAFNLKNLRNIYKQNGLYKEMLPYLRQFAIEYRKYQPSWFIKQKRR